MTGMEVPEIFWKMASGMVSLAVFTVGGYFLSCLLKPFIKKDKQRRVYWVGLVYGFVMAVLKFCPIEMRGMTAYVIGLAAAFLAACFLDRRFVNQKIFLMVAYYIVEWVSYGFTQIPGDLLWKLFFKSPLGTGQYDLQFYLMVHVVRTLLLLFIMKGIVWTIHKIYTYKQENIDKRELLLLILPLFSIFAGYLCFEYISDVYENDFSCYIWNIHPEYWWLRVFYQMVSLGVLFSIIVIYHRMKEKQHSEKEDAVSMEKIEDMKRHIEQVENLYQNIRSLKHDMANHVMTLERLYTENKEEEAQEYISELRDTLEEVAGEVKTGNPVTDVILKERKREAEIRNIRFFCDFHYPLKTVINVFDVSVILNNGLENAMEAALEDPDPYISVSSYCRNNAFLIEIINHFSGQLEFGSETGLPGTTKKKTDNHGYGLPSIRRVARKYYGDIEILQDGNQVRLSVMLMME